MHTICYVSKENFAEGFSVSLPEDMLLLIEHFAELASSSSATSDKNKKSSFKEYAQLFLDYLISMPSKPSPEDIKLYLKVFKLEYRRRRRHKLLMQKLSLDKKE